MKKILFLFATLMGLPAIAEPTFSLDGPDNFDISAYEGKWYEAAKFPNYFERKCVNGATAEYSALPDGNIQVINTCFKASGIQSQTVGKAWEVSDGRLKVSFLNVPIIGHLLSGNYWVLYTDYQKVSIVGDPNAKYGWILIRDQSILQENWQAYIKIFNDFGYDTTQIIQMIPPLD